MVNHRPDSIRQMQEKEGESLSIAEFLLDIEYRMTLIEIGGNVKDESFT